MPRANYLFSMSVVFPLWLKANGQVLMAGFCVSTLSVTLTVGRLREHGCRPFWVSRLHHWDSRIAKPALLLLPVLGRFAAAAPGENLKQIINKRRKYVNRQSRHSRCSQYRGNCRHPRGVCDATM